MYTTDAAGRLTFYNDAAAKLWGQCPELDDTTWCGSWRLYWPDGTPLPHDQCPMAVAIRENRPVRGLEAVAERPDGSRVPFLPFPTPLRDSSGVLMGAINTLVDLSEREQSALALRERDEHYRCLVDLSPQLLWIANAEGKLVDVGERWKAWTGLERHDAFGDRWLNLTHPEDLTQVKRAIRHTLVTSQSFNVEYRFRAADGRYRWVHSRAYPRRDDAGHIVCWYGMTEDVDARVLAELRRNELELELRHAMRLSTLGQLTGTLAHELSQPLAAAVSYIDGCEALLSRGNADGSRKISLGLASARQQIEHASAVVGRLRRFIGKAPPGEQPIDLNEAVSDAVDLATVSNAQRMGIGVDLDLDQQQPVIFADPIAIRQMVLNIVRNAIEAMEDQETRELRVATSVADGATTLIVSDTGAGLAIKADEIFEPFLTTKPSGLGLGLAICRRIVENYDGSISAEANDRGGTTLVVSLPLFSQRQTGDDSPSPSCTGNSVFAQG